MRRVGSGCLLSTLLLLYAWSAQAADPSLIGDWKFAASNGQTVADAAGGRHGTIEAGEIATVGGHQSLRLGGFDEGVVVSLDQPLPITDGLTALLWVRPDKLLNNTPLFGIPHSTPNWTTPVFGIYASGGRAVFGMWIGASGKALVESSKPVDLQAWNCLIATYDGTAARLYQNGALVGELPASGAIKFNDQPLLIGRGLGGKPALRGALGELRLWNRGMSTAEATALYESSKAGYDLARPPAPPASQDGTVIVETHWNSPDRQGPWREQTTRLLKLLDGYQPKGQSVPVNQYGGRTDRPAQQATGFFGTMKTDGRDWLIDPEGRLYYNVAINTVRPPAQVDAHFGSSDAWAKTVVEQLRAAGFNGLGNGQASQLRSVEQPLVWVRRHDFMFNFARQKKLTEAASGTQGFTNRIMPVFHPDFATFCTEFATGLDSTVDDPYLLGIMTDNELQCPVDLLDRCLAVDPAEWPDLRYNKEAAEAWLAARGRSAADVRGRDRYEFIAYAFERYYQLVTAAIRQVDRNHMYLGSRLNYRSSEFDNPWFWRMLAKYHDVISVNYYGQWGPNPDDFADWREWADKPLLLTEWYAKAMDVPGMANTKGAGWLVHTQEDRAKYYEHFTLGALETPNIVGWHWFKYLDDPTTSKALDSAGGANKGLCDIYGTPYAPLLHAMTEVNREAYALVDFFDAR